MPSARVALERRIDDFVQMRLKAHEVMGGTSRAANFLAFKQPSVRKHLDEAQRLGRKQIGLHFAAELRPLPAARRESRTAAIDALVAVRRPSTIFASTESSPSEVTHATSLTH